MIFADIDKHIHDLLQIALGLNCVVHVVAARHELVFARRMLHDFLLFYAVHQSVINAERHARAVGELREKRLFARIGGVFAYRPYTAVIVAHDIVIRHKFQCTGQNAVKEIFGITEIFVLLRKGVACLLRHARFDAVAGLPFVAANSAGDRVVVGIGGPAVEIALCRVTPAGIAADVAGAREGHNVDLLLRSRRIDSRAAEAHHGGKQYGKRHQSRNGAFENAFDST